jgi:hypothetical protein
MDTPLPALFKKYMTDPNNSIHFLKDKHFIFACNSFTFHQKNTLKHFQSHHHFPSLKNFYLKNK